MDIKLASQSNHYLQLKMQKNYTIIIIWTQAKL